VGISRSILLEFPDLIVTIRLSVDLSIRITYHRVTEKLWQSSFYTKSANYVFSQRIRVDVAERTDTPL
jgi:REP element-mobilizing transposase RayT